MTKSTGARYQFADQLEQELMQAYHNERRRQINTYGRISETLLINNLAKHPASRFYTSEERAYQIVRELIAGKQHPRMHPMKREMYYEILARVLKMKKKRKNDSMLNIVTLVCQQKAPCFYLTPGSIRYKISKLKRKCRQNPNSQNS